MTLETSVLMSVYHRVEPDQLKQSLASLKWQTRPADQVVIVIDGPIPDELHTQLTAFAQHEKANFTVKLVPLQANAGLTNALNQGLQHCDGEWIFRMDADDLSMPNRFATQLDFLEQHPEIDVLGSALYEFTSDPSHPNRIKPVRAQHEQISKGFALRNPINHPTVCLRKSLLESEGGYPDLPLLEDYYLWAKLLKRGAKFHNLTVPLYLFRFDRGTLERRRGLDNFKNETWLRGWMHQQGLITLSDRYLANLLQLILRFVPPSIQDWLWRSSRENVSVQLELPKFD